MVVYESSSPVSRGSPTTNRRNSSTRDSSGRHQSSKVSKHLNRSSSPKHAPSRSRGSDLPVREKDSGRTKSPNHRRSSSPAPYSSIRKSKPSRDRSPKVVKARSPSPISLTKNKPSSQRSPKDANSRPSLSPVITRSRSTMSRSPPRSGRSKRDRVEQDTGEKNGKEHEKNLWKKRERSDYDEKDLVRGVPSERRDREPLRDASGSGSRSARRHASSPSDLNRRGHHRSISPLTGGRGHDELQNPRDEDQRNGGDDPLSKMKAVEAELEAKEKQKPSFELSGKLAAETNRVRGVTLLFNEPPDARKPDIRWRLYVFKGGEPLNEPLYVHRQSCYLFGRERRVADIPTDHPSCSKQHAVLQYRQVEVENADGTMSKKVRPYLMDLGSTNGTFINDNQVEPQRYYELLEKDTVKFGNSSREYVLLHENSAT